MCVHCNEIQELGGTFQCPDCFCASQGVDSVEMFLKLEEHLKLVKAKLSVINSQIMYLHQVRGPDPVPSYQSYQHHQSHCPEYDSSILASIYEELDAELDAEPVEVQLGWRG